VSCETGTKTESHAENWVITVVRPKGDHRKSSEFEKGRPPKARKTNERFQRGERGKKLKRGKKKRWM